MTMRKEDTYATDRPAYEVIHPKSSQITLQEFDAREDRRRAAMERRKARALARGETIDDDDYL